MKTFIKEHTNTFVIHGYEFEVTAPARFDAANQLVDDDLLDDAAVEITNQLYRDKFSLVSPTEIKQYRLDEGLTREELAECLGIDVRTIAMYEAGAFPSKKDNDSLKSLMTKKPGHSL